MEFSKAEIQTIKVALAHFIDRADGVPSLKADLSKVRNLREKIAVEMDDR